jgi:hypothetical protein
MGVGAYQGGTTMKTLASVLVLLAVAGGGRADEKAATERLQKADVWVLKQQSRIGGVLRYSRTTVSFKEGTKETDCLLDDLRELRDLKILCLDKTDITDAGLRQLEALPDLLILKLKNCPNLTEEGVARLQHALPNCRIRR